MDKASYLIVFHAIFAVLMLYYTASAQNVFVVGGDMGWEIPPNSSVSYSNWVSGRTFMVGDTLEFNFVTNEHDVLRVPEASYNACSQDNAIGTPMLSGPLNITLDSVGNHYYICTFGRHCQAGQRLAITVASATSPGGANQPDACAPISPNAGGPSPAMAPPGGFSPDSASSSVTASFMLILLTCAGMMAFILF
ncbi:hypothetical protein ACJIZ3_020251 [Penstemon smallii]|uniref:Phytocyanin domain-containing protein n=1 Tax=Penstemon smallii TaxID=265156 RepID=A0ABD3SI34_9LAMI